MPFILAPELDPEKNFGVDLDLLQWVAFL